MPRTLYYLIFIISLMLCYASCKRIWGDESLGNNLSLLEGDKKEDRVIVFCSAKNNEACKGGIYVVPTYNRHYENGNYSEYVEDAKSNRNWVIAKTIQIKDKRENFWIISKLFDIKIRDCQIVKCDSILQTFVTGPLNSTEFRNKTKELNIDLKF